MDTMDAVSGCDYCDHENGEIEAETEEAPLPKKLVPLVRRKKKYRMIRFCCVPGCSGKASRMRAGFVLHSFPQPKDKFMRDGKWVNRREEWLRMVGLSTETEVTKSMFVCTKHFEREDYFNPDLDDNRRSLKRDAIPSMNLPELPQEIPQKRLHMVWMPAREGGSQSPHTQMAASANELPYSDITSALAQTRSALQKVLEMKESRPPPDSDHVNVKREVVESPPQDQSLVTVKTEVTDNGHLGASEESSLSDWDFKRLATVTFVKQKGAKHLQSSKAFVAFSPVPEMMLRHLKPLVLAVVQECVASEQAPLMTLQYDALLSDQSARTTPVSYELRTPSYASWLSELGIQRDCSPDASASSADSVSEAEFLYRQVPVLCLVQAKTRQQVRAVYNNWGRHCNRLVFFGSIQDPYVPVHQIPLSVADAQVTCLVLRHVLHKYGGEFSWVLLVDDETFAIVENLRFYVAPLNSSAVYYLGHPESNS
ncbi:uncharacterized protein ISCGN_031334 [Ixodes scapularis]